MVAASQIGISLKDPQFQVEGITLSRKPTVTPNTAKKSTLSYDSTVDSLPPKKSELVRTDRSISRIKDNDGLLYLEKDQIPAWSSKLLTGSWFKGGDVAVNLDELPHINYYKLNSFQIHDKILEVQRLLQNKYCINFQDWGSILMLKVDKKTEKELEEIFPSSAKYMLSSWKNIVGYLLRDFNYEAVKFTIMSKILAETLEKHYEIEKIKEGLCYIRARVLQNNIIKDSTGLFKQIVLSGFTFDNGRIRDHVLDLEDSIVINDNFVKWLRAFPDSTVKAELHLKSLANLKN